MATKTRDTHRLGLTTEGVAAPTGISKDAIDDSIRAGRCTPRYERCGRRITFPIPSLCASLGVTPATLVALGLIAPETAALLTPCSTAAVALASEVAS